MSDNSDEPEVELYKEVVRDVRTLDLISQNSDLEHGACRFCLGEKDCTSRSHNTN